MKFSIPAILALSLLLPGCAVDTGPAAARESLPGARTLPGWIAVDFEDGTTAEEIDTWEKAWGVDLSFNSLEGEDDGITIGAVPGDLAAALTQIKQHPAVETAEPLYVYRALYEPDDPDFKYQWHMTKVNAKEAWDETRGKGVVVAVIDTGVAYRDFEGKFAQVEDLKGATFVPGYDFVNDRPEALDDHGHGTHVAGTIAQVTNNGKGVTGLAFEASIMPVKVLSAAGGGTTADIADAIRWSADHGAQVINMSLGGGGYSQMMANAVAYARKKGVVVVAAAGNSGTGNVSYPAAYPGVIAVSATRFDDKLAPYSSWGKQVDIAAPGGDKNVDQNGDGKPDGVLQNTLDGGDPKSSVYAFFQGTSMATPHVAAAAALVMSTGVTRPAEVEAALFDSARKVHGRTARDNKYGHGVLDAAAAVRGAREKKGLWRMVWTIVIALMVLLRRGRGPVPGGGRLAFLGAAFVTGTGFFFLPDLVHLGALSSVLATPLMDWGVFAFGASAHANPLTWSAAIPVGLTLLLYQRRALRPILAGVAMGTAAFLLHGLFASQADVVFMPGRLLDIGWLAANAAVAFLLGWSMMRKEAP